MEFFSQHKVYDFMKVSRFFIVTTLSLALFSAILFFSKGMSYGIDFSGGTIVQLKYEQPAPIHDIRQLLAKDKMFSGALITEFGSPEEVQIRFATTTEGVTQDVGDIVRTLLKETGKFDVRKVDIVGPKVGGELRQKGIMAAVLSMLGIMVYVAFRFEWTFAVASIITLLHDVCITVGALILFDIEMSLDVLAAILTLIGYSINDTIIIYDRIREELKSTKDMDLMHVINTSVSKTLSRTILTVLTVFFVVFTLYLFGGEIIHGFSFTMLLGLIIGSYSSIFISAPFLKVLGFSVEDYKNKMALKEKNRLEKAKMRSQYEKGTV
ncbi:MULTISPECIES: protein translocase subunit SecF [unclassified Sulfurospirillum]|jgi:preprotein translocase subunit SecF|uniref:Protein-export membrane protein SecF n=1 Tax=Sulfurospirillum cavolei TaxID=366522 RepID=A0A2D3WG89_9BACT|nr:MULTISPECIES: protein translocase subunit SecF [unclassified Sulfurospirillum]MCD8544820.1 protein translocase subunit SecF [Sulfurospirillum cavolei]KHG34516.1 MAG: preprotein translocase subunit SecF [Sulfurospirillum sp. MES]MCP3650737.1 protein translocase subunit SecF [Sulfurospirillum sp. DNRA8]MCR1809582.1 protein translocase subunit SecF [Sulfurospirillum sp. DNRA8]DAB36089.1 MAG TPA: protein translocase subunit SecF [Sulfurospirillum cavolei]